VVASAPVSREKRAGGSKRASETRQGRPREAVGEAQGEADMLDLPPGAADAPARETSDWTHAPEEAVTEVQYGAGPVAPAAGADEATDGRDAPAGETSDWADAPHEADEAQGDAAPSGENGEPKNANNSPAQTKDPMDASVALAAEASDRADDATTDATETTARSREPSETIRGASEKGASAAQPKSRTRKRSADGGGVASKPTEPGSADDNADTAGGTPRPRKRTKRTPRTTTPQGERTPQQSR
jgi:hypothetical protein